MSDSNLLQIQDGSLCVRTPEGVEARMELEEFLDRVRPTAPDTSGIMLPDGVKFLASGRRSVAVVQQISPRVHRFRWIDDASPVPFGNAVAYREVRLALPYVIVVAVFQRGTGDVLQLSGSNECFFRNHGLRSREDKLAYPALLNCSRADRRNKKVPLAWICTQHLAHPETGNTDDSASVRAGLHALWTHLLDTGFNLSSEHHELSSWFTETTRKCKDARLRSVDEWQTATDEDPRFATTVEWLPTGFTVQEIVDRALARTDGPKVSSGPEEWSRIVVHGSQS